MLYKDKYLKYKNKYLNLKKKLQQGGDYGYVLDNQDITQFKNVDLRDTLNEPAMKALLDGSMPQQDVNKHLLTAIITVDNRIQYRVDQSKTQQGGDYGYVLDNQDITQFKNVDLRDTLNEPAMKALLDGSMPQQDVNKHLLTAIITVDNRIQYRVDQSKTQQGDDYDE